MNSGKGKNILILFLIVIIIVLTVFIYMLLNGKINFTDNNNDNNSTLNNDKYLILSEKDNVERSLLDRLLPVIGIDEEVTEDDKYKQNMLSYTLLELDYNRLEYIEKKDALDLILAYTYFSNDLNDDDYTKCLDANIAVPAGSCVVYPKSFLLKAMEKFDIKYSLDELLDGNKEDSGNYYVWGNYYGPGTGKTHNITSWYGHEYEKNDNISNNEYITIRDEMTIDYYDEDISSRIVYYTFILDDTTNNYKLYFIDVK